MTLMTGWISASSSVLNFDLAIFLLGTKLVVLILYCLLFHVLQRNLSKKYPTLVSTYWKLIIALWQHRKWTYIFVQYWLAILWNVTFFLWYNDYIQSVHLQNCTLNRLFTPVSDFYPCFLVIIRLYIQGIHVMKPISWPWNKSHSAEYAASKSEKW